MDTAPRIPSANQNTTPNSESSVKYIRTFAGDMKTVQENGVPDLVPLVSSPTSAPTPTPTPTLAPTPAPQSAPLPTPAVPQPPKGPVVSDLKTYAGDFSDKVKETHASTATVLAAEQDARPFVRPSDPERPSLQSRLYIIAGAVLLVLGSVGVYLMYTRFLASNVPIILAPSVSAPIFFDEREEVAGMGETLLQEIRQSVMRPLAPGAVRLLLASTTENQSLFSLLDISAPAALVRNISAKGSMAGVVHAGGVQSPFFILSVTAYGSTFSSMLAWETVMPRSLEGLFPAYPAPEFVEGEFVEEPVSVIEGADTVPPPETFAPGFRDEIVANHDARVYRDREAREILIYGYWNQTTLVIARDSDAFGEILERLATSRVTP